MKKILPIALCFILASCGEKPAYFSSAQGYFHDYVMTDNAAYLDSSYQALKSGNYLKGENNSTEDFSITVLLYMKKYDEAENLLIKKDNLETQRREVLLNLTRALKTFPSDSMKAKGYISDNIEIIKNKMKSNPNDSLLWVDYFNMRAYMVGKDKALLEVDSMASTHKEYTSFFYKYILKDGIEDYPDILMFDRGE